MWQVQMESRGKIHRKRLARDEVLENRILEQFNDENDKRVVSKDFPFVQAALASDSIVLSMDERARARYSSVTGEIKEIRRLVWRNIDTDHHNTMNWIRAGAKRYRELHLHTG